MRGLVQGVGFRPHVWRLATECGLAGEVWNDAEGVLVRLWGMGRRGGGSLSGCARRRRRSPGSTRWRSPPLAEAPPQPGFHILASHVGAVRTGVVPDAATCAACLAEVRDPRARRHGYAFANCTHCGPRLSIVQAIPYDRAAHQHGRRFRCARPAGPNMRTRATAVSTRSRSPARIAARGCGWKPSRARGEPARTRRARCSRRAGSSRSRGSAASISRVDATDARPWRGCARASGATTSRSR